MKRKQTTQNPERKNEIVVKQSNIIQEQCDNVIDLRKKKKKK